MSEQDVAPENILDFWFGERADDGEEVTRRFMIWFRPNPAYDLIIRERFTAILERAVTGEFNDWAQTARGSLALIIMLDQFPRNIFRGEPRAFATDERAVAISKAGIARGFDGELSLIERVFFYVPFEHAEDLVLQDRCVNLFQTLDTLAPPAFKEVTGICVDESRKHREVIRRFGRYPYRNDVLGRVSSAAERAWAEQHHGWGQNTDSAAASNDGLAPR